MSKQALFPNLNERYSCQLYSSCADTSQDAGEYVEEYAKSITVVLVFYEARECLEIVEATEVSQFWMICQVLRELSTHREDNHYKFASIFIDTSSKIQPPWGWPFCTAKIEVLDWSYFIRSFRMVLWIFTWKPRVCLLWSKCHVQTISKQGGRSLRRNLVRGNMSFLRRSCLVEPARSLRQEVSVLFCAGLLGFLRGCCFGFSEAQSCIWPHSSCQPFGDAACLRFE